MAMFGRAVPGYGGGMFPEDDPFGIPDYMGGINDALAQNQALGQQQQEQPKKKGIGDFLKAFAGFYGDSLTGNPVYSNSIKAKRDSEASAQDSQAQKDWWYEQQRYQQANKDSTPGIADEANWYNNLPPEEKAKVDKYMGIRYPSQVAPQFIGHDYELQKPGAPSGGPTATGPNGEKIRYNPQSGQWEPLGGASQSNGSGGFLGQR